MKKIIYIEKSELNAIVIVRDNYKGVVVQVIRFVDQLVPSGDNNKLVNVRNSQVIDTSVVNIKPGSVFKDEVSKAITKSREFLAGIKLQDQEIEGLMANYYSQNKGLNEDEQR